MDDIFRNRVSDFFLTQDVYSGRTYQRIRSCVEEDRIERPPGAPRFPEYITDIEASIDRKWGYFFSQKHRPLQDVIEEKDLYRIRARNFFSQLEIPPFPQLPSHEFLFTQWYLISCHHLVAWEEREALIEKHPGISPLYGLRVKNARRYWENEASFSALDKDFTTYSWRAICGAICFEMYAEADEACLEMEVCAEQVTRAGQVFTQNGENLCRVITTERHLFETLSIIYGSALHRENGQNPEVVKQAREGLAEVYRAYKVACEKAEPPLKPVLQVKQQIEMQAAPAAREGTPSRSGKRPSKRNKDDERAP